MLLLPPADDVDACICNCMVDTWLSPSIGNVDEGGCCTAELEDSTVDMFVVLSDLSIPYLLRLFALLLFLIFPISFYFQLNHSSALTRSLSLFPLSIHRKIYTHTNIQHQQCTALLWFFYSHNFLCSPLPLFKSIIFFPRYVRSLWKLQLQWKHEKRGWLFVRVNFNRMLTECNFMQLWDSGCFEFNVFFVLYLIIQLLISFNKSKKHESSMVYIIFSQLMCQWCYTQNGAQTTNIC